MASEWHGDIPVRLTNLSAFGDLADTFTVGAGATVTIDPTLTEPGTVSGMMISERTGGPIDGAPVRLYPLDGAKNVGDDWIEVNTIADGTFVVDDPDQLLVAGNYKLEAPRFTDAGGLTWDGEWWKDANTGPATVLVVAAGADTALTIDRHGPGALTGTVTEDGSGDPVEGVTVTLYEDGGIVSVGSTTTAADGTYTFVEVNGGTFDLEFTATGYDTEWFDNAADAASGSIVIADSTETSSPVTMADAALVPLPGSMTGLGVVAGTLSGGSGTDLSCMTANLYDTTDFTTVLATQQVARDNTYSFTGLITTPVYTLQFVSNGDYDCAALASEWYGDIPVRLTNLSAFGDLADTFTVGAADSDHRPNPDSAGDSQRDDD